MSREPRDAFDSAWYCRHYPDVRRSGLDARVHWDAIGRWLNRAPNEAVWRSRTTATDESMNAFRLTDERGVAVALEPIPAFEGAAAQDQATLAEPARVIPGEALREALDPAPDLGVHLHLHYRDLLGEMVRHLACIPFDHHLYVSVTSPDDREPVAAALEQALPRARVEVRAFENRGRDLGPFVAGFRDDLERHEFLAHVHGKRSPHSRPKADWRAQLLQHLLGSEAGVRAVFREFREDDSLGLVFPVYHASLRRQISWGGNFSACERLAPRLGLTIAPDRLTLFPAGSMFWARSRALVPLFRAGLDAGDFPEESGQVDGTPAHALERLLGEVAASTGHGVLQVRHARAAARRADPSRP